MSDIRYNLYNKTYANQNIIMKGIINELDQIRNSINNNLLFKRIGDIISKINYLINENNKNLELIRNDISKYFHILDNKIDKMQINVVNIKELTFNDGKYVGYVKNKLAEGKGIYYYNNGEIYEGDWKNDKREGKGIYYFKNGDRMMGDYLNNRPVGKHVILSINGNVKTEKFKIDNNDDEDAEFNDELSSQKIDIFFRTTSDHKTIISIDKNRKIENLIKLYFKNMGHPECFGDNNIRFLCNSYLLYHDSQDLIKKYIRNDQENITIIVNDLDDKLIA